jgi:hypothetical protein
MECNIVFFADNENHAMAVLKRMFKFYIECCTEYKKELITNDDHIHKEEFLSRNKIKLSQFKNYLDNIGKIKLSLAPRNQFYVVGWADNDTI